MFEVHFESDKNSRTNNMVSPLSIYQREIDAASKLRQSPEKLSLVPQNSQSIRIVTTEN